jgi:hypothetical protein
MTGLVDRAVDFLVVPSHGPNGAVTTTVPVGARAVVLGLEHDAPALAAALALTLRAAARAPTALVAVWHADDRRTASTTVGAATPSASKLAARLGRRDLTTAARGRLVWVVLPHEPAAAATALHHAAAAVDCPTVTALVGPRPPAFEAVVDEHDLVAVAADPGSPLAAAAQAALADRCLSVLPCRPIPRGLRRALALAGLLAPRLDPPLRATSAAETRS